MSIDLWPIPDPATGDGSEYGEGGQNDGTPGAVDDEPLVSPPAGARVLLRSALAPIQRLVLGATSRGGWPSIPSPNYSSRRGAKVRLGIFHTAEGALTRASLGSFFARTSVGASSHTGIDDTGITRYVPDAYSAWTARNANPVSVQTELCGFAAWKASDWAKHSGMLENAAIWAVQVSRDHGIPLVRLTSAQSVTGTGFCMHRNITEGWRVGSHVDCGDAFPLDAVLARARQIANGTGNLDADEQELENMKVDNPFSGEQEDAAVAIGYMEQRVSDRVTGNIMAYLKSDEFLNAVADRASKNLLGQPVDDVATWDSTTQTVVQKPSSFLYLIKRAAEASPVRHFLMDKTK